MTIAAACLLLSLENQDLWRLDLTTWEWDCLPSKGGPSARSGHRMAIQVRHSCTNTCTAVPPYEDMCVRVRSLARACVCANAHIRVGASSCGGVQAGARQCSCAGSPAEP
jgi:hypothetical protein